MNRRSLWRPVGVLTLAGLCMSLAIVWQRFGENTVVAIGTIALVLLTAVLSLPVVQQFARRGDLDPTGGNQTAKLCKQLAKSVEAQWLREAEFRQLSDPYPLAVRWRDADPRLMDWPEAIMQPRVGTPHTIRLHLAGSLDKVVEPFMALPLRRLVVLGEPGAGKTTALVILTLGLLKRWQPSREVPVYASLATWDPQRARFVDWFTEYLNLEYPFLKQSSRALIDGGHLLPVLDGLDEMPEQNAGLAIKALNELGIAWPLVMACRTVEFRNAVSEGDVLTGGAVVLLEPLTPQDAVGYLRISTPRDDRLDRWELVFNKLESSEEAPLTRALSTPLMLTLARSIYALSRTADPAELADDTRFPSREAIEDHLLDSLVPTLISGAPRWTPSDSQRWLGFLARHLSNRGTRDLAWWELLPSGQYARPVFDYIEWLTSFSAPTAWFLLYVPFATLVMIGAAVAVGLQHLMRAVSNTDRKKVPKAPRLLAIVLPLDREARVSFLVDTLIVTAFGGVLGLVIGALAGGAHGLLTHSGLVAGIGFGVPRGLVTGVVTGGLFGLMISLEKAPTNPSTPRSALKDSRTATIVVSGGFALIMGFFFGYTAGVGLQAALTAVAVFWVSGLTLDTAWARFQSARIAYAVAGLLPWRTMAFFGDMHRVGILRQVGAVYQFRHARLQDRLARR